MSATLVSDLVALGKQRDEFPDVVRRSGINGTVLVVSSNRQAIARASAEAAGAGREFSPTQELRRDEVTVRCVDTNTRFPKDCERVVVLTDRGQAIPPLRGSSGPQTLHAPSGASWVVKGAEATYAVATLREGFVVTGVGRGSETWTLIVTREDVSERLLLGIPLSPGPPR